MELIAEEPFLCLNMIVKNESHLIRQQLEKLLSKIPQIDYWVISDTGSTDNTKEIIVDFFKERNIQGELFQDEWKDFGYNRTLALEHAFSRSKYLIVFDADDEIVGDFELPIVMRNGVPTLEYDSYYFMFGSANGISYNRVQLVTNKKKWRYIGVLHESIECPQKTTISTIKGNYYTVSGRSGARNKDPDKYLKDALVLEKAHAESKQNNDNLYIRYAFYCGNSYFDCGKSEEAIKWHKITLEQPNWVQEKYISCMKLYESYKKINQTETGIYYLVKAFAYDKQRVECLYDLVVHYCLCDLPDVAYNYYLIVRDFYETKYLQSEFLGHKLFICTEKHDFLLPYYMIIVADKVKQYDTVIQMYRIVFTKKTLICEKFYLGNLLFNLQFFIDKVDPNDTDFFKLFKEYVSFLLSIQFPVFDYDFMIKYEKYGVEIPKPHVPIFSKEVCRNSNKIMIYTGFSNVKWNYSYMKTNAIGGSESAVAYLANNLDKGYDIYVVGDVEEEHYDNIHYVSLASALGLVKREAFRTIIVSRYISFYQIFQNFSAYETYIWAHDTELLGFGANLSTEQILTKYADEITGCVCQTAWHKELFQTSYPALKDKILTINNGISTEMFPPQNQKVKNRFMYSSCSERGLSTLLDLWPEIVNKLPDAQLFISSYNVFPKNEEERKMEQIILSNKDTIKHVGKLSQKELYDLMSTVEYWLYTNCFLETSCITSLEMLASQVICLYYPIAGLNDTIGDYGIKVQRDNEISTLLLLVDDEERKNKFKTRGKEYAMSCSWRNRASIWSNCVIEQKKIAIFNSFPFHYEMFGFILHYAEKNNYSVDIYTNTSNDLGWFEFYQTHFGNDIKIISCSSFEKRKGEEYDFIFVTTDDDSGFQSNWINERVVCINHFFRTRNNRFKNYFNIANFTTADLSALTCYPLGISKKECIVTVLGGSAVTYQNLEINIINRLRSSNPNEKLTINFIGRNISTRDFEKVNQEMFHINVMPNLYTEELIEQLRRSSYVLINYTSNDEDRRSGKKIAGSLPLALSALCVPILSRETNKQLQLKNCLEYEDDSVEPIYLSKLDFHKLNELQKERQQNIDVFDSFMKQVERKNEIFYVKIFADEGVTSWLEMYMEHELSLSSYKNKVVLTKENNYTHAVIINTCMPVLKTSVRRERVIGLSHEPYEILFSSSGDKSKFISYAEKYIGKYFIGDKRDLPSPFVEGQPFLVHNKPPPAVLRKKEKFCSFVVSNKRTLEGNQYRHELLKAIIETTNLPIDIYGYSSTEYSKIYPGDERIKYPLRGKEDVPFGTEPYEQYRFNICIENVVSNHYFSEKIVNPSIYNTIPVYLGCRNIDDYIEDKIKLKGNVVDDIKILTDLFINQEHFASLQIDTEATLRRNNLFYNLDKLFDNIEKSNFKIYVVHYKKLTERKQHLLSQFLELGIRSFEFISIDRDDALDTSLFEDNYSKTQIAISLSHMYAYKDIAANNLDYGIILEDDVLLCPYFLDKLNNYMKQLPPDFGAVFLGEGCGISEHRVQPERFQPYQNVYLMEQFNKTKCTDSYVVSCQCAKNIVEYISKLDYKINEPIDWWLNRPLREIVKTDVYWCEPTLAKQGTITGRFQPSYQ
jgi:GR25 family glycosyltransferase involved in LPS biosynthesis/glycosyltransferase involved in cell wall biosynthesis